jgi:hypothetical protein
LNSARNLIAHLAVKCLPRHKKFWSIGTLEEVGPLFLGKLKDVLRELLSERKTG